MADNKTLRGSPDNKQIDAQVTSMVIHHARSASCCDRLCLDNVPTLQSGSLTLAGVGEGQDGCRGRDVGGFRVVDLGCLASLLSYAVNGINSV